MAKKKEVPEEADDEKDKDKEEGAAPEGEETEGGAEGEEGTKKGFLKNLSRKKKIIIGAVFLVLLAGGTGVWYSGILGGGKTENKEEGGAETAATGEHGEGAKEGEAATGPVLYYNLPEFLVNLNSGGKQTSFLKMEVTLAVPNEDAVKALEANLPRVQDAFNTYLRELRASDLSGSAGLYRLKEELLLRLNSIIAPQKVNDILFKEILVQ